MPLDEFIGYRNGVLHVEDVNLADLFSFPDGWRTPFYVYSAGAMTQAYERLARATAGLNATICYAMKANPSLAIVNHFARLGAGADIVSEGEYRQARKANVPADKIVFAGVGKTGEEMAFTHAYGLGHFSVESEPELDLLSWVCSEAGQAPPQVLLRVNPDVIPETHGKISTGQGETKFGIPLDRVKQVYAEAQKNIRLNVRGLHIHIGSQLTNLAPLQAAFRKIAALVGEMRSEGLRVEVLDLGGGLGVTYHQEKTIDPQDYGQAMQEIIGPLGCQIILEPGRFLVANAGILVSRALYVKKAQQESFLVVDAAMNDLIRPTLYDAWHDIVPVKEPAPNLDHAPMNVVGPVCETGDYLAMGRPLPPIFGARYGEPGDLIAILSAGAYTAAMGSNYNARLLPAEAIVRGSEIDIIRHRQSYDDLYARDVLPAWVNAAPGRAASG